jgi:NTE family protein
MLPPWRLKVGLALGGGAARGLAHIGVLRALIREGIPIDIITGTSMGAVIGGAYAALGDIGEVERRIRGLLGSDEFQKTRLSFLRESKRSRGGLLYSVTNLVRRGIVYGVSTMRPSFLSAEEFARSLGKILPDVEISTTPIRFAASAVDLETAHEVVLCHGRLRDVAAASAAIPGILPPRRLHGRLLIDGGWVDKIPVLPAFRLGADIVIGVDISADLEDARRYARGIDVVMRANTIKDAVMTALHRRLADILIEPAVRRIHWADFAAADFCITAGDKAATEVASAIRELLRQERFRSIMRRPLGKRMAQRYLAAADLHFSME